MQSEKATMEDDEWITKKEILIAERALETETNVEVYAKDVRARAYLHAKVWMMTKKCERKKDLCEYNAKRIADLEMLFANLTNTCPDTAEKVIAELFQRCADADTEIADLKRFIAKKDSMLDDYESRMMSLVEFSI
jgi:hypothetical protein